MLSIFPRRACGGASWVSNTTRYDCNNYYHVQEQEDTLIRLVSNLFRESLSDDDIIIVIEDDRK